MTLFHRKKWENFGRKRLKIFQCVSVHVLPNRGDFASSTKGAKAAPLRSLLQNTSSIKGNVKFKGTGTGVAIKISIFLEIGQNRSFGQQWSISLTQNTTKSTNRRLPIKASSQENVILIASLSLIQKRQTTYFEQSKASWLITSGIGATLENQATNISQPKGWNLTMW